MKLVQQQKEFLNFLEPHKPIIHRISILFTEDRNDGLDLYQDIIYQLWKYWPGFRGESKPSTYIYKVAFNTACTRFKKERKRKDAYQHYLRYYCEFQENDNTDQIARLYAAISNLRKVDKTLVMLYLEDSSLEEIAEILGISNVNVRVKMHRIKKQLKETIKKTMQHEHE